MPSRGQLFGNPAGSGVTAAQLAAAIAALGGVYQPLDSDLTAIALLTTTPFGRALLTVVDAAGLRTVAALGTAAVLNQGTGATDLLNTTNADARYQPLDSDLTAIALLTTTPFGRGLLALAAASDLRTAAGLGTAAVLNSGTGSGDLPTTAQADARYAPFDPPQTAITPTTGAVALDFAALDQGVHLHGPLTGAITYSTTNLAAKRSITIVITNGATLRAFAFPAWIPLGAALPASIAANKTAVLTVYSPGTTDAACVASYQAQP